MLVSLAGLVLIVYIVVPPGYWQLSACLMTLIGLLVSGTIHLQHLDHLTTTASRTIASSRAARLLGISCSSELMKEFVDAATTARVCCRCHSHLCHKLLRSGIAGGDFAVVTIVPQDLAERSIYGMAGTSSPRNRPVIPDVLQLCQA